MLLNMPVWVVLHYVEERIWSEHGVLHGQKDALAGGHAAISTVIYKLSILCQTLFM